MRLSLGTYTASINTSHVFRPDLQKVGSPPHFCSFDVQLAAPPRFQELGARHAVGINFSVLSPRRRFPDACFPPPAPALTFYQRKCRVFWRRHWDLEDGGQGDSPPLSFSFFLTRQLPFSLSRSCTIAACVLGTGSCASLMRRGKKGRRKSAQRSDVVNRAFTTGV